MFHVIFGIEGKMREGKKSEKKTAHSEAREIDKQRHLSNRGIVELFAFEVNSFYSLFFSCASRHHRAGAGKCVYDKLCAELRAPIPPVCCAPKHRY